jgi:hypothetical protein
MGGFEMITKDSLFYSDAVALQRTLSLVVNTIREYVQDVADKAMLSDWEEVATIDLKEDKNEILERCKWASVTLKSFVEDYKQSEQ